MLETISLFGKDAVPGLVAQFTARLGGVSEGPYSSLNLGLSTSDARERVLENRRRVAAHLDCPLERWTVCAQVHGADIHFASSADSGSGATSIATRSADAVFLAEPGVFALSLSADCPIVVLVHGERRLAAVAHAGWRGTVAGILPRVVDAFRAPAGELDAAISPGICGACYPVGTEVWEALGAAKGVTPVALDEARVRGPGEPHLDLRRVQRGILTESGLRPERIRVSSDCSSCDARRYFSHRRDRGVTGRTGALVGWR